ncbi:MAG: AsmA family protein [Gammaproteobacteria bacterium]|nr:AsmA family protein [Gammaproteobacteria bacterium]
MNMWVKRGLWALSALGLALVLTVVGILVFVDPNDYKPEIQQWFAHTTGRQLEIKGDLSLAFFPWLGLEIGEATIGNPKGFTEPVFARIQSADIKVAVLPLFRLETRVGTVRLHGLQVNLEKAADARVNWASWSSDDSAVTDEEKLAERQQLPPIYIGGLEIEDAGLVYDDKVTGVRTQIEHWNVSTDVIETGKPLDFETQLSIRQSQPKVIAGLQVDGQLHWDLVKAEYRFMPLNMQLTVSGEGIPNQEQHLQLMLVAVVTLDADQMTIEKGTLQAANMDMNFQGAINGLMSEQPTVDMDLRLATSSIRQMMTALAMEIPETSDPKTLGALSLDAKLQGHADAMSLKALRLKFDDTQVTGHIELPKFEPLTIRGELQWDNINADRYLAADPVASTEGSAASNKKSVAPVPVADTPIDLPKDLLRTLDVLLAIKLQHVQFMKMSTHNYDLGLRIKDSVIDLDPFKFDMYDGRIQGKTRIDIQQAVTQYTVNIAMKNVQAEPLMKDFMEMDFVRGLLDMNLDARMSGESVNALKRSMTGEVQYSFRNGVIKGMNVTSLIKQAKGLLKGQLPAKDSGPKETPFGNFSGGGPIKNGVMMQTMKLDSDHLLADAQGNIDIANETLNIKARADYRESKTQVGMKNAIPFYVKGSFAAPSYGLDTSSVKTLIDQERTKLKAQYEAEKTKLKQEADQRIQQEKDKAEKEAKDKLKDKLKKYL